MSGTGTVRRSAERRDPPPFSEKTLIALVVVCVTLLIALRYDAFVEGVQQFAHRFIVGRKFDETL
eukprot:COSAG04_NODE_11592_length_700_cov_0.940100_2_plen_65_part_00